MPTRVRDPGEGIGLAARVILHLADLSRLGPNDMANLSSTQQGMVAELGVRQDSLVKVLQRLVAGNAVIVDRRFVLAVNRRMKVYRLSTFGESVARDLRHSRKVTASAKIKGPDVD